MPVPFADSYRQQKEITAESPASLVAIAGFFQSAWLTRNGGSRGEFAIWTAMRSHARGGFAPTSR